MFGRPLNYEFPLRDVGSQPTFLSCVLYIRQSERWRGVASPSVGLATQGISRKLLSGYMSDIYTVDSIDDAFGDVGRMGGPPRNIEQRVRRP
jgi:hypothetical protein